MRKSGKKIVVLDDDPTGTQTVQNVPVLTEWSETIFKREFEKEDSGFYVLTNSRSCSARASGELNLQIGRQLSAAAKGAGTDLAVVSRSDSTLRGHFPSELHALQQGLGMDYDIWMLVPAFIEGGRFTIDDVHYVMDGDELTPVGLTEFARDPVFGYRSSNMVEWVMEKFHHKIDPRSIFSLSLKDIREGGPEKVTQRLETGGRICIANAASVRDLEILALGALRAEADGKNILYRSAASFARLRLGVRQKPPLAAEELTIPQTGGSLVIVGSHVPKTTRQLEVLLAENQTLPIEVNVAALLDDQRRNQEISRAGRAVNQGLSNGENVVLSTERRLVMGQNDRENLNISQKVSEALVAITNSLSQRPRFIITKGGITSSDIATRALNIRRALVKGQLIPGVPVWECDHNTRYPGLCYVIFPGNVGDCDSLSRAFNILNQKTP